MMKLEGAFVTVMRIFALVPVTPLPEKDEDLANL